MNIERWTMNNELNEWWKMKKDQWSMNNEQWTITRINDQWTMIYDQWIRINDRRRINDENWTMKDEQ